MAWGWISPGRSQMVGPVFWRAFETVPWCPKAGGRCVLLEKLPDFWWFGSITNSFPLVHWMLWIWKKESTCFCNSFPTNYRQSIRFILYRYPTSSQKLHTSQQLTIPTMAPHVVKHQGSRDGRTTADLSPPHAALRAFTRRAHQLLAKQHQRSCQSRRVGEWGVMLDEGWEDLRVVASPWVKLHKFWYWSSKIDGKEKSILCSTL